MKIGRTLQFPKRLDVYEFASEELQKKLQIGRIKDSEQRDREVELSARCGTPGRIDACAVFRGGVSGVLYFCTLPKRNNLFTSIYSVCVPIEAAWGACL